MRVRRSLLPTVFLLGAAFVGVASCREPTQMVVSFKTNACGDAPELGVVTAPSLQEAQRRVTGGELTTTQTACVAPSMLGTLTLTPGGDSGGTVVATLALRGKRPEDCLRDPAVAGCITSRRRFAFLEHTPLAIEIPLDLDCEGKACDAFTTCSRGSCVDARVECESNGACSEPGRSLDGGLLPDAPPIPDAGPIPLPDAGLPLDAGPVVTTACPAQSACRGGNGCLAPSLCCLSTGNGTSCGLAGSGSNCAVAGCCASDLPCPATDECCLRGSTTVCVVKGTCSEARPCQDTSNCRSGEACGVPTSGPPVYAKGVGGGPMYCQGLGADGGPTIRDGGVVTVESGVPVAVP